MRDHCLRTWIYMKDVDIFYSGMVDAPPHVVRQARARPATTHFIACTGIEGGGSHRYDVVAMDAYSCLDVEPRQISYLNDFDRLCATKDYNVTFERGDARRLFRPRAYLRLRHREHRRGRRGRASRRRRASTRSRAGERRGAAQRRHRPRWPT